MVLVYEFWLKFRKTPYFQAVYAEVVQQLFVKYGDESVFSVIEDMGISEAMIAGELSNFLVPIFEQAYSTGFMEQQLRAHFEPFYRSPALSALLQSEAARLRSAAPSPEA